MASIRCKACGCTYDYNKEGMCPKCGAYNRPPRRERVDPDGSIHYLEPRDAAVPPHHGKKICYEKKTCYGEHTRRSRQPADTGEADDLRAQEWENLKGSVQRLRVRYQTMDKKQRGNVGKITVAVVIGLVLLLNSCNIHRGYNVPEEPGWSEGNTAVAVPEPTYADYQMHEWFDLLGSSVAVTDAFLGDDGIVVTVEGLPEDAFEPGLSAYGTDGSTYSTYPMEFTRQQDDIDVITYDRYFLEDVPQPDGLFLTFDEFVELDGELYYTGGVITVDLTDILA